MGSPVFNRWFEGSCVVDSEGGPLVVFHGTRRAPHGITEFDTRPSDELGAHFGTIEQAHYFVDDCEGVILPVFLNIKKPLRLEDRGAFTIEFVQSQLDEMRLPEPVGDRLMEGDYLRARIAQAGYDGVVYLNRREGSHDPFGPDGMSGDELSAMTDDEVLEYFPGVGDSYVVFAPEQIKFAIGIDVGFNRDNPYSRLSPAEEMAVNDWFGVGSMLDDVGRPRSLYHGTNKVFVDFKRSKTGAMGAGIYLGDERSVADCYDGDGTGQKIVMEVYARGKYLSNMQWSDYIFEHGWASAEMAARADGWAGVHDTMFESAVCVWDPQDVKPVQSFRAAPGQGTSQQPRVLVHASAKPLSPQQSATTGPEMS